MIKKTTLATTLFLLGSCAAWAGSVCPAAGGSNPFPHPPDPSGTGCNVLITINSNGTATVTVPDSTPYESSDDALIGVLNNSSGTVSSLALTGSDIFGFESDGICIYTFVGSGYCSASQKSGTDPGDYAGPSNTFTITNANTGTVNFSPGIGAGGTAYFSLEGVPTASLAPVPTIGPGTGVTSAPRYPPGECCCSRFC